MAKNSGIVGIAAMLLIMAASGERDNGSSLLSHGSGAGGLVPPLQIGGILRDLHKLTFIMNHMDNLGQMALNPAQRPKLPPPSEMLSRAIPDLSSVIEAAAPFIAALGSGAGENNSASESEGGLADLLSGFLGGENQSV